MHLDSQKFTDSLLGEVWEKQSRLSLPVFETNVLVKPKGLRNCTTATTLKHETDTVTTTEHRSIKFKYLDKTCETQKLFYSEAKINFTESTDS